MSEATAQELLGFKPKTSEPSGPERSSDSPLLDFWCQGAGYSVKTGVSGKGRQWIRVSFRGTDVEVIDSTVPYPYPTSEISMFYSDPTETPKRKAGRGVDEWTAFCASMRDIYGNDSEDLLDETWGGQVTDQDTQPPFASKRMHLMKVPTLMNVGPNSDASDPNHPQHARWHDEVVPAWKVVEIEGVGKLPEGDGVDLNTGASNGVSPAEHALNIADGKTEDQFNAEATNDPVVMKDPPLMTQIADKAFLSNMVMLGMLTKDTAGVYHKK